jgi:hypothetical protein
MAKRSSATYRESASLSPFCFCILCLLPQKCASLLNIIRGTINSLERGAERNQMIPFLSIASRELERDLDALRLILNQVEKRTHSENAYRFSERAEMAAGWWFYDVFVTAEFLQRLFQIVLPRKELSSQDKKSATIKLVDIFQGQLKKSGSDVRVKMHGDIPFAAPWWAWLMR